MEIDMEVNQPGSSNVECLGEKILYLKRLFSEDGYAVNKEAKALHFDKEGTSKMLYGETVFDIIEPIFCNDSISPYLKGKKSFCDLGSGTGNVVVSSAHLLGVFERYTGIEILERMYTYSQEKRDIFISDFPEFAGRVNFINGDILNVDLSFYDVFFINYPMSDSILQERFFRKIEKELSVGDVVIMGIGMLDSEYFEIIDSIVFEFSWGPGSCRYYVKVK